MANKHSFQNADLWALLFDWQLVWLQSGQRPREMFRDEFHMLYMVRLEVVCVLFNRISAWIDSLL